MRRSSLIYLLPIVPFVAGAFESACSSDDDGTEHGPAYGVDSGGGGETGTTFPDGSFVFADGAPVGDAGCTSGTLAIVGGGASGSFASIATGDGAFTTQNFASLDMAALPAVIAFGSGFQAVFHVVGSNQLVSTGFASPSWSSPAVIPGTLVREMPTLAVEGTSLHLLYQANDDAGASQFQYYHGTFSTTWTAGDPVGTPSVDQSFGPHAPGAAGLASELVAGQVGTNKNIYARSWTGSWQSPVDAVSDGGLGSIDGTYGAAPRMVAMNGGAAELLLVYTRDGDYKLMSVARTSGTWASAPTLTDINAYTTEPFQLAALAGGKAIVAWRGSNTYGYVSMYDGSTWSTPNAVAPFAIQSAPSVSIGNCGSVAIATYAKSTGSVEAVRYDGTTWGAPATVAGATNATYVAIAISP